MAEPTPPPRVLLEYHVIGTADLAASGGFEGLAPPSGFHDASSGPHFFTIRCLFCGEETKNDIAVYALYPDSQACTDRFGSRRVIERCHPTCSNPCHMVRKCAGCRQLGSVEVREKAGCLNQTPVHFLTATTLGAEIVSYAAGEDWEATSAATGEVLHVSYHTGRFTGHNAAGDRIYIPTGFNVVRSNPA